MFLQLCIRFSAAYRQIGDLLYLASGAERKICFLLRYDKLPLFYHIIAVVLSTKSLSTIPLDADCLLEEEAMLGRVSRLDWPTDAMGMSAGATRNTQSGAVRLFRDLGK